MSKLSVVFCRDCKFSEPDPTSTWQLRCHNPEVNRNDSWALSSGAAGRGTDCRTERDDKGWFSDSWALSSGAAGRGTDCRTERDDKGWFSDCGRLGKLYEPKEVSQ